MSDQPTFARVGAVGRCMAHPSSYKNSMGSGWSYRTPTQKDVATHALRELEKARAADIAQHEINLPILAANAEARAKITALMTELGIKPTFSQVKPSRSRFTKRETLDAGYIGDMRRDLPLDDGFTAATASYELLKARYDAYAAEAEGEAERIAAAKAAEDERRKAERRANLELAEIILRYDLDRDAEWPDVLEALRIKDQRLDLAVAMAQTRGDWSEGPYRVRDALGRFTITTDEDKAIANDVIDCLTDFDDGRVFRDTTWSYGALFASVADQQLSADVQTAMNREPR